MPLSTIGGQRAFAHRALAFCIVVATFALQGCSSGADTQPIDPPTPPPPPPVNDTIAPTVPQSVTATAVSAARIDLSWSASTDAGGSGLAGYRVYRNDSATPLTTVTTTSYADTSVTASTTYSFTVRAVDNAGNESAASSAASATTPNAPTSGLDSRPSNTSCLAWARPSSTLQLDRYTGLSFAKPIAMLQAPNSSSHWYVVRQDGYIHRFSVANPSTSTVALDIDARVNSEANEAGLLGMAFHPNFPTDSRVFLSYTATDGGFVSRISSFTTSDGGATFDPQSEVVLMTLNQPGQNHNGGHIAFGPDGHLYIGFGDGGGSGDPHGTNGNGQRLTTLLGKLLRIDVNVPAATRYAVPSSNPFFDSSNPGDKCERPGSRSSGTCPEIYAYGLRNPWRFNFDAANDTLWLADVGQGSYEEVNTITPGGNYGWRCREGAHDFNSDDTPACATATTIDPVAEYPHSQGMSITGGYVYRGTQTTNLLGRYVFGDFVSGRIWAWIPENTTARAPTLLLDSALSISSFAQGNDKELYALDYGTGRIYRLLFQASAGANAPTRLSETGCVNPSNAQQPAAGLIPYDINAGFWSDGASKERWIALPNDENISIDTTSHDWDFPSGTVLMKQFRNVSSRLIETRLLLRHPGGNWGGVTYEWNAAQTDATLVTGGAVRTIDGQDWIFPSETQCMQCHTQVAGRALGPETSQMNREFLYTATNRTANQLTTLSSIDTLTPSIANPTSQPRMPSPSDTSAPLAQRARAYLHTNCAFCHRSGGPTPSNMDLRFTTSLAATNACNTVPQMGDLGLGAGARLIAPGNAAMSIVVSRANRRDAHAMPPVGSNQVDTEGVALLTEWINGLSSCN